MIVVVDYGMGNLGTVSTKIRKMDNRVMVSSKPEEIDKADKIILPGVGSFKAGIENLSKRGLIEILNKKVLDEKTPILGICLGMQLFTTRSEEGEAEGLGWIDAETIRFKFNNEHTDLKIPHMGWNTITIKRRHPFLNNIEDNARFYFVHSYHAVCNKLECVTATTEYGYNFPSILSKENIFGVQFHPERSHKNGMQLLKNFVEGD